MAIDFPNSPTTGDLHTVNGKQWQWDAEKWIAYGVSLAPDVLKVDSGNNRVGINQTSPAYSLDVTGTARITGDLTVQGTTTTIESTTIAAQTSLTFEGATADDFETTLTLVDPTADRTITLPNNTGTVALTSDLSPYATLASPTLTGTPAAPTASANTNTTQVATTAFVMTEVGDYLTTATASSTYSPLASPTFTGIVNAAALVAPLQIPAAKTASYTLVIGDAGKLIEMDVGSGNTLTIPTNTVDFDVGTQIMVIQKGSGATTIAGAGSVAIYSKDSNKVIDGQYATVTLVKRADTGDGQWHLIGALTS
jgi:hypothetical protein